MIDYCAYILFRVFGFLIRLLPVEFVLFLARRFGEILYFVDYKHRALVFTNIKTALGSELDTGEIKKITRNFYRSLAQDFAEIFLMPKVDSDYIARYIRLEGRENIDKAFAKGHGVIFLGVHSGSWEISNVIFANMGFAYNLLVRTQNMPRLNALLDDYRIKKGCKLIRRHNQIRELITALKANESVGMTIDQGGKNGEQVKFFGKTASFALGAIKLALKYDAVIIPGYHFRERGPYIKTILGEPFVVTKTGNNEQDIKDNLNRLVPIYENYIRRFPQDYFWRYKIWKYSKERTVLILSDGKAGHLHQSTAVAMTLSNHLRENGFTVEIKNIEPVFNNDFSKHLLNLSAMLSGKFSCQNCLFCLRNLIRADSYKKLVQIKPDIVISCGSSLAALNYILSCHNQAKSVVIMKPSTLSMRRFNLVVMPRHDRPPKRNNVAVIDGALNQISQDYLETQKAELKNELAKSRINVSENCIGLLLGGDTKDFKLDAAVVRDLVRNIKISAEKENFDILVTTSRRTPRAVEEVLEKELGSYHRCKLLLIANKKNYPYAVGGIMALSKVLVVSPESISMISEASASNRYVLVFNAAGLGHKHEYFLNDFASKKYIYRVDVDKVSDFISELVLKKPAIEIVNNQSIIKEWFRKVF